MTDIPTLNRSYSFLDLTSSILPNKKAHSSLSHQRKSSAPDILSLERRESIKPLVRSRISYSNESTAKPLSPSFSIRNPAFLQLPFDKVPPSDFALMLKAITTKLGITPTNVFCFVLNQSDSELKDMIEKTKEELKPQVKKLVTHLPIDECAKFLIYCHTLVIKHISPSPSKYVDENGVLDIDRMITLNLNVNPHLNADELAEIIVGVKFLLNSEALDITKISDQVKNIMNLLKFEPDANLYQKSDAFESHFLLFKKLSSMTAPFNDPRAGMGQLLKIVRNSLPISYITLSNAEIIHLYQLGYRCIERYRSELKTGHLLVDTTVRYVKRLTQENPNFLQEDICQKIIELYELVITLGRLNNDAFENLLGELDQKESIPSQNRLADLIEIEQSWIQQTFSHLSPIDVNAKLQEHFTRLAAFCPGLSEETKFYGKLYFIIETHCVKNDTPDPLLELVDRLALHQLAFDGEAPNDILVEKLIASIHQLRILNKIPTEILGATIDLIATQGDMSYGWIEIPQKKSIAHQLFIRLSELTNKYPLEPHYKYVELLFIEAMKSFQPFAIQLGDRLEPFLWIIYKQKWFNIVANLPRISSMQFKAIEWICLDMINIQSSMSIEQARGTVEEIFKIQYPSIPFDEPHAYSTLIILNHARNRMKAERDTSKANTVQQEKRECLTIGQSKEDLPNRKRKLENSEEV